MLATLKRHANSVWCVTFSPDGEHLLSASFDQTIKLWSISTGKCLQVFTGHQASVTVAKFSTDSQYFDWTVLSVLTLVFLLLAHQHWLL
ncbi:MAG: hypothetical protein C4323_09420 [Mastigocladus sp. ERB_26_2]